MAWDLDLMMAFIRDGSRSSHTSNLPVTNMWAAKIEHQLQLHLQYKLQQSHKNEGMWIYMFMYI